MSGVSILNGVVRGNSIELDGPPPLPEGSEVSVVLTPRSAPRYGKLPPGEGLRRAFGGWADDQDGLDEFLEQARRARDLDTRSGAGE